MITLLFSFNPKSMKIKIQQQIIKILKQVFLLIKVNKESLKKNKVLKSLSLIKLNKEK